MRQHLSPSKQYQLKGVDMSAYIYRITNHVTNQSYIGKTEHSVQTRFKRHLSNAVRGDETYLYRSIRKYGVENFSVELVEETSPDIVNDREIYYIKEYTPEFNMTSGGDGGSTTHNRTWVNNGINNLYLLTSELVPNGYIKGRLCKFNDPEFQRQMGIRAQSKIDLVARGKRISESKIGKTHVGVSHKNSTKDKLRTIALNRQKVQCEHCDKLATAAMYARWHGDNCKYARNSDS